MGIQQYEQDVRCESISSVCKVHTIFMHYACTSEACRPFLSWILQQANTSQPALVQSISVGTTEHEYVEVGGAPRPSNVSHPALI